MPGLKDGRRLGRENTQNRVEADCGLLATNESYNSSNGYKGQSCSVANGTPVVGLDCLALLMVRSSMCYFDQYYG